MAVLYAQSPIIDPARARLIRRRLALAATSRAEAAVSRIGPPVISPLPSPELVL